MTTQSKHDWSLIVAGVALVVLGIVFLLSPALTLVTLAMVAGAGLLAVGVVDTVSYFRFRKEWDLSGWNLAYAVCDILLGGAMLIHPMVSAAVLPWVVGIFLIIYGILEIVTAWQMRKDGTVVRISMVEEMGVRSASATTTSWGWALFGGIVAIACALLFFVMPATFAVVLAAFLIIRGVVLAAYGVSSGSSTATVKA